MANEIAARAESDLRATARGYARTGMGEESVLDDACVGSPGRVLGVQRCREIIREEFAAATAAADGRMAAIRAERRELPITDDGLAEAVRRAGWGRGPLLHFSSMFIESDRVCSRVVVTPVRARARERLQTYRGGRKA